MAAIDQSEFQGVMTLLESRGIIGIKKAKESRLNKVNLPWTLYRIFKACSHGLFLEGQVWAYML